MLPYPAIRRNSRLTKFSLPKSRVGCKVSRVTLSTVGVVGRRTLRLTSFSAFAPENLRMASLPVRSGRVRKDLRDKKMERLKKKTSGIKHQQKSNKNTPHPREHGRVWPGNLVHSCQAPPCARQPAKRGPNELFQLVCHPSRPSSGRSGPPSLGGFCAYGKAPNLEGANECDFKMRLHLSVRREGRGSDTCLTFIDPKSRSNPRSCFFFFFSPLCLSPHPSSSSSETRRNNCSNSSVSLFLPLPTVRAPPFTIASPASIPKRLRIRINSVNSAVDLPRLDKASPAPDHEPAL